MHQISILLTLLTLILTSTSSFAQEKSEDQLEWENKVGENALKNPAFAYIEDDPALPSILLIGDSISIGYTPYVCELLKGKANVNRIPMNGGNTNRGLEQLEDWLGEKKWDVIHFNWGLHDIKRLTANNKMAIAAPRVLSPEEYKLNIKQLTRKLKATKATLIWASTTPVPKGAAGRIPGDEVEYNAIAKKIMDKREIVTNDLYTHILSDLPTLQRKANVHFHSEGSKFLAEKVVEEITHAIE